MTDECLRSSLTNGEAEAIPSYAPGKEVFAERVSAILRGPKEQDGFTLTEWAQMSPF